MHLPNKLYCLLTPDQWFEGAEAASPLKVLWQDVTVPILDLAPYQLTWDLFNGPQCRIMGLIILTTQDLPGYTFSWELRVQSLTTQAPRHREPLITSF